MISFRTLVALLQRPGKPLLSLVSKVEAASQCSSNFSFPGDDYKPLFTKNRDTNADHRAFQMAPE